jgi:uncharacterized membrane protein
MDIRGAVEFVGLVVDLAGVGIIVVAIVGAGIAFARSLTRDGPFDAAFRKPRQSIGRGILVGLERLVAGDIIRTVAIAPTFSSVGVLAVIVAIRTFLSFSLEVELTGHWPWQQKPAAGEGHTASS